MAIQKLNLTRDQLASFLKNHDQIKQFENLFDVVDKIAPDVVQETAISAALAQATSDSAMGQISALTQELGVRAAITEGKINQLLSLIDQLTATVESIQTVPPHVPTKRSRFGVFLDTTTQIAISPDTPQVISFNTTSMSNGVFLDSPFNNKITVDTEGVYNLQFSIQLDKTSGGSATFWIWPRVNGVDLQDSASQVQIQGNNSEIFTAANFFFSLAADDYIQLVFAVSDVSAQLQYFPADTFRPAIPSIIVTVSNNIES